MRPRALVMVHHSLTPDGKTVSWQAIRRYHVETQGWADIGYHAGVELVNDHLEALLGRPEDQDAAACKESHMNTLAMHVCFVGNFDLEAPSDALLAFGMKYVIRPWLIRYNLTAEDIVGHRDFATYKSCPGKMFDLARLKALV